MSKQTLPLIALLTALLLPGKGLFARTNQSPEYLIKPPQGWKSLTNRKFDRAWIAAPGDPLAPQIYFIISRNVPEPNEDGYKKLISEIKKAASGVPDGTLTAHSRSIIRGIPVIDFDISYTVYQEKDRIPMGKRLRAFYSRGDQFMFMTLYRQKDRTESLDAFRRVTGGFRLTGAAPRPSRKDSGENILVRSLRSIRRYWWLLVPIALLSGYVVYRDKRKKQVDDK